MSSFNDLNKSISYEINKEIVNTLLGKPTIIKPYDEMVKDAKESVRIELLKVLTEIKINIPNLIIIGEFDYGNGVDGPPSWSITIYNAGEHKKHIDLILDEVVTRLDLTNNYIFTFIKVYSDKPNNLNKFVI